MKIGDRFSLLGYTVLATAFCHDRDDQQVMVLCNDSSHFLVAVVEDIEQPTDVILVKSYPYFNEAEENARYIYSQALTAMTEYALEH